MSFIFIFYLWSLIYDSIDQKPFPHERIVKPDLNLCPSGYAGLTFCPQEAAADNGSKAAVPSAIPGTCTDKQSNRLRMPYVLCPSGPQMLVLRKVDTTCAEIAPWI